HQTNSLRCLDPPGFANLDFGIARVLEKRRQPADLEFGAAVDQYVRVAQRNHKTRTRIDEVRIFSRLRQNDDVDLVSANFSRERTEIGKSGDNVQLCLRRESE